MTAQLFFQSLINGLNVGALLALLALGLTLLFSVMDMLFFAHGALYMFGAFTTYYLCVKFGLNYLLSGIIAIVVIACLGILMERGIFRRIRGQFIPVFLVAIGLNWFLESTGYALFGIKVKSIPTVFPGSIDFLGATITWEKLVVVIVGLAAVVALHFFLTRTKWGMAMRAFVEDPEAAELQGIRSDTVCRLVFAIGCSLAGLAGFLVAPLLLLSPTMGGSAILNSFLIIALGGLGSIPGALIAAFTIGIIQSFSTTFLGAEFSWGIVFLFVVVFLIIRPRGIMGVER